MNDKIVFLVRRPDITRNVILEAPDREGAKRDARALLAGDPENYIVTPLTEPGSRTVFLLWGD